MKKKYFIYFVSGLTKNKYDKNACHLIKAKDKDEAISIFKKKYNGYYIMDVHNMEVMDDEDDEDYED